MLLLTLKFMGPCIVIIFQYISNKMQHYTVYFIWKLLYMFRVVPSPIIRNANNCIYSVCYLSYLYCYLPLSCKSWILFGCVVGGVWSFRQASQAGPFLSTITCVCVCVCVCVCPNFRRTNERRAYANSSFLK